MTQIPTVQVVEVPGGTHQLFYRGQGSERLLVLRRQLPQNDWSSTAGQLGHGADVAGMQVRELPPSQAVIWGSQGLGGILNLEPLVGGSSEVELGSQRSAQARARVPVGAWGFEGQISRKEHNTALTGDEKDQTSLQQWGADYEKDEVWGRFFSEFRHFRQTQDYDLSGSNGVLIDDPRPWQSSQDISGQAQVEWDTSWLQVARREQRRTDHLEGSSSSPQNSIRWHIRQRGWLWGWDLEQRTSTQIGGIFVRPEWAWSQHKLSAGLRLERREQVGGVGVSPVLGSHFESQQGDWTWDLDAAAGARAPSPYQVSSLYGNASLTAEDVQHFQMGGVWRSPQDSFVRVEIFSWDVVNAVDFDMTALRYQNRDRLRSLGLSLSLQSESWRISGTRLESRDGQGKVLPRRAEWLADIQLRNRWHRWHSSLVLNWTGERKDISGETLQGQFGLQAEVATSLKKNLHLGFRLRNFFFPWVEQVSGFNPPSSQFLVFVTSHL